MPPPCAAARAPRGVLCREKRGQALGGQLLRQDSGGSLPHGLKRQPGAVAGIDQKAGAPVPAVRTAGHVVKVQGTHVAGCLHCLAKGNEIGLREDIAPGVGELAEAVRPGKRVTFEGRYPAGCAGRGKLQHFACRRRGGSS